MNYNNETIFQINKVLSIGGKSEKDFVRRSLTAIFENDVACICSWTGQKNNFKISDTNIILAIKSKSI